MKFEINGVVVEALDIAPVDHDTDEIGIWVPCSPEIQDLLDGQECNLKIEITEERRTK